MVLLLLCYVLQTVVLICTSSEIKSNQNRTLHNKPIIEWSSLSSLNTYFYADNRHTMQGLSILEWASVSLRVFLCSTHYARFSYWHTAQSCTGMFTRITRKSWPLWHHNPPIVGYAHSARKYAVRAMHPVKFTHASSKICHASVKMSSTFLHGHASSKFLLQDAW